MHVTFLHHFCLHGKPCIVIKEREYVDRRGFHPLSAPSPIRYSMAGFNWGIQENFRDSRDNSLSQRGSPSGWAKPRGRGYISEYPNLDDRFESISTKCAIEPLGSEMIMKKWSFRSLTGVFDTSRIDGGI